MTHSSPARLMLARIALRAALAAAVIGLGGCGKKDADGATTAATTTAPVARIAPPAGKAWADVVSTTPEGGYRMGNPAAPIKLVEYGSLTCPHCAEFASESSAALRDTYVASGRVSFEFRNFVRDAIDVTAAMLTRCAAPESYFALTDQVFANQAEFFDKVQKAGNPAYASAMALPDATRFVTLGQMTGLTDFFAARGVSRAQAGTCLANAASADALAKATSAQTEQYAIEGTPTFLVNGEKIGTATWDDIKARLEAMGAR